MGREARPGRPFDPFRPARRDFAPPPGSSDRWTGVPESPKCPECRVDVQPSCDWCMSCGSDPEGLKPTGWLPPASTATASATVAAGTTLAPPRPVVTTTHVEDARPQLISDPDWVQTGSRHRLSYMATVGVLAAILVAVAGLVFVILMVLHQPVGTKQADALSVRPPSTTISVPAVSASR